MTHSSQAGLASFASHTITHADLMAAKAAAWDEGYLVGTGDGFNRSQGNTAPNPYRTLNVEGTGS